MGALAADFDSLVSEFLGPANDLFERQRIAAIPKTGVGDAVEADTDVCGWRGGDGFGGGGQGADGHGGFHEVATSECDLVHGRTPWDYVTPAGSPCPASAGWLRCADRLRFAQRFCWIFCLGLYFNLFPRLRVSPPPARRG